MTPTNSASAAPQEPVVILKRETENAFALKFHEAELLVLPAQGGDNFTGDEQNAIQSIVTACNAYSANQSAIKELAEALEKVLWVIATSSGADCRGHSLVKEAALALIASRRETT